jgi:hypothetical protein
LGITEGLSRTVVVEEVEALGEEGLENLGLKGHWEEWCPIIPPQTPEQRTVDIQM